MGRRRSDSDMDDYHFYKLIEIPFSPFRGDDDYDDDNDDFDYAGSAVRRRGGSNYGSSRQEYLRSYTFSRSAAKQTLQERIQTQLGRLKAAAWATFTCNPYNLPRRVRRLKDKFALRSARHSLYSSQRSRSSSACRVSFLHPCFRA